MQEIRVALGSVGLMRREMAMRRLERGKELFH